MQCQHTPPEIHSAPCKGSPNQVHTSRQEPHTSPVRAPASRPPCGGGDLKGQLKQQQQQDNAESSKQQQ